MKKQLAAILAALSLFNLASCAKPTPVSEPAPAPSAAAAEPSETPAVPKPAPSEPAESAVDAPAPEASASEPVPQAEDAPPAPPMEILDEPETIQADIEEIVSLQLTIPRLTLSTQEATERANDIFSELADTLRTFAQTTVYDAAREKQTIGFVEGDYSLGQADGALVVTYHLTERYASESGAAKEYTRVFSIDPETGELLGEES